MNRSDRDAELRRIVPALLARDMRETLAFYEGLGFSVTGRHPDGDVPRWAELTRGQIVLQFHTDPPHGTPTAPVMSGTLYVQTRHVDALAAAFEGRVVFEWGPEEMDYGGREFGIRDPNGYYLAFSETS